MSGWELVVGLEVHAQLATRSKLFCACPTDGFGAASKVPSRGAPGDNKTPGTVRKVVHPFRTAERRLQDALGAVANTRVCPVCTGQPGVLPVLNARAVELAFSAALALDCRLAAESIFARKNYFYPDLPKAYQISQYEQPFSQHGGLDITLKGGARKRVRIHRIHLEEDAGKLLHAIGSKALDYSLVDFNRGGTPLIEIVTEPDIRSADEAYAYLAALKQVLQYSGASRCDMEKGEMRCDANVSVRRVGDAKFGTRAEIKNLNSFKNVKDAIGHEFARQVELLESGGRVAQETRLWDAATMATVSMRSKEEAHDYRYFPDPDLLPLAPDPGWIAQLKGALPELPAARRSRFISDLGLSSYDAELLTADRALADYFEAAVAAAPKAAKTVANYIASDLQGKLNAEGLTIEGCPVPAAALGRLAALIEAGTLSSKLAKDVLAKMWETHQDPDALVARLGLTQVSDEGQIRYWVRQALSANAQAAADLRGGKEKAAGAIVGYVMKVSKGKANPTVVNKIIKEEIRV